MHHVFRLAELAVVVPVVGVDGHGASAGLEQGVVESVVVETAAKGVSLDGCSEGFVTNQRKVSTIKIGGVSQMPLGHCKP